jgi:hypothetical protein
MLGEIPALGENPNVLSYWSVMLCADYILFSQVNVLSDLSLCSVLKTNRHVVTQLCWDKKLCWRVSIWCCSHYVQSWKLTVEWYYHFVKVMQCIIGWSFTIFSCNDMLLCVFIYSFQSWNKTVKWYNNHLMCWLYLLQLSQCVVRCNYVQLLKEMFLLTTI